MSTIPNNMKYTNTHEWVRDNGDGTLTIGITDHAQDQLGDLVFVDLPKVGATASVGKEIAVVESVKAASDIYSPLDGEVTAVNEALTSTPEQINSSPYTDGWILSLRPANLDALDTLLSANDYQAILEAESN